MPADLKGCGAGFLPGAQSRSLTDKEGAVGDDLGAHPGLLRGGVSAAAFNTAFTWLAQKLVATAVLATAVSTLWKPKGFFDTFCVCAAAGAYLCLLITGFHCTTPSRCRALSTFLPALASPAFDLFQSCQGQGVSSSLEHEDADAEGL